MVLESVVVSVLPVNSKAPRLRGASSNPNAVYNSSKLSLILSNATLNGSPFLAFADVPILTVCFAT